MSSFLSFKLRIMEDKREDFLIHHSNMRDIFILLHKKPNFRFRSINISVQLIEQTSTKTSTQVWYHHISSITKVDEKLQI